MGKSAILTVATFMFAGGMYAFSAQRTMQEGKEIVSRHQMEVLARNAALAGYNQAKQKLADNFSGYGPIEGTYEGVDYKYEVGADDQNINLGPWTYSYGPDKAGIVSVGTYNPSDGSDPITYTVQSKYERETQLPNNPPTCLEYVICAEQKVRMNGNIDIYAEADGESSNRLNANVHSNGELDVRGNSVNVRGFGTYSGYLSGNHQEQAFNPYDNDADQPQLQSVDAVDIPTFTPSDALDAYGGADRTDGDVQLSGTYDLTGQSTREDPYVWHVTDDLELGGDATIKGYVVFIVGDGDNDDGIRLTGKNSLRTTSENGESNVAFYTGNETTIDLKGGSELHGQIFAGGDTDVSLKGNSEFYGTITTRGSVTLGGNPTLYYRPASPGLTQNWQDSKDLLRRISHSAG